MAALDWSRPAAESMSGARVLKESGISVTEVLEKIKVGSRTEEIVEQYGIPPEQAQAVAEFAAVAQSGLTEWQHYEIFRDYVKHEDDLINHRLNWNFTIQGFLFAAYTLSMQKIAELKIAVLAHSHPQMALSLFNSSTLGLRELRIAMLMVALVGLFVSFGVYLSVSAARMAIDEVTEKWNSLYSDYQPNPERGKPHCHGLYLPGIIGGGRLMAHKLGFYAPRWLSLGFIAAWSLLVWFWVSGVFSERLLHL